MDGDATLVAGLIALAMALIEVIKAMAKKALGSPKEEDNVKALASIGDSLKATAGHHEKTLILLERMSSQNHYEHENLKDALVRIERKLEA